MGKLVEIYESWEKPGGLSQDGMARIIKEIKRKVRVCRHKRK